jgi:Fe-S-cluster containining protein
VRLLHTGGMQSTPTITAIDAGSFGNWLAEFSESLRGNGGTNVPCGDCVGCCASSYSILVRPSDTRARAAIASEWLTPVPSLGEGMLAMGYLPDGTCPMLREGRCSVYRDRPQTCRDYDCRVFAAAGLEAGAGKDVINARVAAWRFSYANETEREIHRAIRDAAAFIGEHHSRFPELRLPKNPSGIAVLAVKSYPVFLGANSGREPLGVARAIVAAARAFDEGA